MKVIYNSILPIGKNKVAITLYPFIFVKRKHANVFTDKVLNHENIHGAQVEELGLIIFYFMYLVFFARYGYSRNPFELEAYNNDDNLYYLNKRAKKAWKDYIFKK